MKQRLAKLKLLQTALSSLQAATNIKARLTVAKELTNVLKDIDAIENLTLKEVRQAADDYSDNPNDENYRYADTGYIAGSHKERASNLLKIWPKMVSQSKLLILSGTKSKLTLESLKI